MNWWQASILVVASIVFFGLWFREVDWRFENWRFRRAWKRRNKEMIRELVRSERRAHRGY